MQERHMLLVSMLEAVYVALSQSQKKRDSRRPERQALVVSGEL